MADSITGQARFVRERLGVGRPDTPHLEAGPHRPQACRRSRELGRSVEERGGEEASPSNRSW